MQLNVDYSIPNKFVSVVQVTAFDCCELTYYNTSEEIRLVVVVRQETLHRISTCVINCFRGLCEIKSPQKKK